ncbi:MAG TPA: hypothetical protein VGC41_08195 [Kofleriaceae bacterium]
MKALLVLLVTSSVTAAEPAPSPLTVDIKPAITTWHVRKPVAVVLTVENRSKTKQAIVVWLCSWGDNWTSNDADLGWDPWACNKNFEKTETLEPGAAKHWTLSMYAMPTAKRGSHALRLGFTSGGGTTLWSNQVEITVEN